MWGGIIEAVGGLIQNRRAQNKQSRRYVKDRQEAIRQFNEQMNESVQRRVKDAQKAGIHPLFAMGGSSGASPTANISAQAPQGGYTETGSGLGNALGAIVDLITATTKEKKTDSTVNEMDAQLKAAQLARMQNWASSQGRDKIGAENASDGTPTFPKSGTPGLVETLTSQVTSHNPNAPAEEAGLKTPYVRYKRSDGSTGLAYGADVPGAEELNMVWIPLQNWWHTSKEARRQLRDKLGITKPPMKLTEAEVRRLAKRKKSIKKFFSTLGNRLGPPRR